MIKARTCLIAGGCCRHIPGGSIPAVALSAPAARDPVELVRPPVRCETKTGSLTRNERRGTHETKSIPEIFHRCGHENPDPEEADTDELAVFKQGARHGAAHFDKLEGCWSDASGRIYFISSDGSDAHGGQVWLYEATDRDSGRLTLVFKVQDRELLDMPDNTCVDPKSSNLYLCEDSDYVGAGGTEENYVRILTPGGRIADFAKNILTGYDETEVAGATFSPDGRTLFFNIQTPGITVAVWGNFDRPSCGRWSRTSRSRRQPSTVPAMSLLRHHPGSAATRKRRNFHGPD